MSARGFAAGIAVLLLLSSIVPARAAVEIQWWHAMQNELKRLLEQLAVLQSGPPLLLRGANIVTG